MVSEKRSKIKEFQWSERVLADGMGKKFMRITFFMFQKYNRYRKDGKG